MQQYLGNFKLSDTDTLSIRFCGEQLCIRQNGQPGDGYKMIFEDIATFSVAEVPNAVLKIILDKEGKVDALELAQGGRKQRLPKLN